MIPIMVRYMRNQGMMMGRTVWTLVIERSDNRPSNTANQPWHIIAILPKDEAQSFFAKDFAKHDESSVKSQNMGIRMKKNQTLLGQTWDT